MTRVFRKCARALLRIWGQSGVAPGWRHRVVERWGNKLAESTSLDAMLANGCSIPCDIRDHIQRFIYFWGVYEPIESYLLSKLLRPGMVVVDGGGEYRPVHASGLHRRRGERRDSQL
jgi:hypothetical protein